MGDFSDRLRDINNWTSKYGRTRCQIELNYTTMGRPRTTTVERFMYECRTSRSDESPANILVFWREDILCPWLKPMPNSFLPMQRKKIQRLKSLRTPPFCSRKLSKVVYRGDRETCLSLWHNPKRVVLVFLLRSVTSTSYSNNLVVAFDLYKNGRRFLKVSATKWPTPGGHEWNGPH